MDAINDDMRGKGIAVQGDRGMTGFVNSAGLGEFMSFDPKTPEGGKLLIAATLTEPESLESMANTDILVANFYAHDVESRSESGEVSRWTRIVVFDNTGKPYACGSLGVRKCLGVLFQVRGSMPWVPPVKCKVKTRRLGNGNSWMTLEPDMDSLYPQQAKKK